MTDDDCILRGIKGVDVLDIARILISYGLVVLVPLPSVRDTSVGGRHEMATSTISTQSLRRNDNPMGFSTFYEAINIHNVNKYRPGFSMIRISPGKENLLKLQPGDDE